MEGNGGNWRMFCPEFRVGNASLSAIWDPSMDDLLFCYRQFFVGVSHALFLLVCGYHSGKVSWKKLNHPTISPSQRAARRISTAAWILRLIVSVAMTPTFLVSFCLQTFWLKDWQPFGIVSYAAISVSILSWVLHGYIAWKLAKSGPYLAFDASDTFVLFLSWLPVFLTFCLEFRASLLGHSPNQVYYITAIVIFSFQLLFLTSGVLQLYSSCIYVKGYEGQSRRSSVSSSGSGEMDSSDNVNLIDGTQPSQSASSVSGSTPKLGQPRFCGPLNFLLFLWVDPLMQQGADGVLHKAEDLFELPVKLRADQHAQTLQKALVRNPKTSRFYLPKTLFGIWGLQWSFLGIMQFASSILQYTSPLFVNFLVNSVENPGSQPEYYGYLYGFGLIAVNLMAVTTQMHYTFQMDKLNLCMQGALVDTVYSKLLRVHSSALSESMASGQVVNLVGTDCEKVSGCVQHLHEMWALPLQIAFALYLLYQQVGLAFFGGVIFIMVLVPVNQLVATKISKQVEENLKLRDARVKLMSEALNAIRVIKLHAWEKWFSSRVGGVRIEEMKTVRNIKYLDAFCVYFWSTTPMIMSVLTFTTYVLMGNTLTAAKVFTCLSVFGLVLVPLNSIPWIITGTVEAWVSAKRLQKFLKLSEIDLNSYYTVDRDSTRSEDVLTMRNGSFSWIPLKDNTEAVANGLLNQEGEAKNQLEDIDFTVKRGELVGIVGKVGSGKTSLLNAVVAEMFATNGTIELHRKEILEGFGFVPQDNWIQEGTIMSNIQFSLSNMDSDVYQNVVKACALEQDLQGLPHGSLTQIGEHGVTLSGGQKARIALARAVLQNKDVILLDDPLSAVDAQVANHIFNQCILKLLRGKTRLLVTHHIDFLRVADRVVVMDDGKIVQDGPPSVVLPTLSSFKGLDRTMEGETTTDTETESEGESEGESSGESERPMVPQKKKEGKGGKKTRLIEDEQREYGSVKASVYKHYWKAVGNFWATAVFVSIILMQASYNVTDWWLSYWVTHDNVTIDPLTNKSQSDSEYYLKIYGSLGAANSLFALMRSFIYAYAGLMASYHLHDMLLAKVLRGRMVFFDTTPSGRILNRFAKDIASVDNELPFMINIFLDMTFELLGTLVVICYGLPWFILVLIPMAPLYYFIQRYYRATSREVKRINTLTESPIYSLFSETVEGLSTIRAMRADAYFYNKYKKLLDDHLRAHFADMASSKWLNMRLQLLGVAIVSGVVLTALLVKSTAGTLGLTVSYSLRVVGTLSFFFETFTETEKEMVSVERIAQYLKDIEEEKYDGINTAPPGWPQQGAIEYHDISLRYREDLPDVLTGLSLVIEPAERIGVVGRTGAGKSSFLVALFRMAESHHGFISVDGIDIARLPLNELRSRLAIIPQTPNLFDASIRENLDPLQKSSDEEIWTVVDMCDLRGVITKLGGGLEVSLGENGRKLSMGQKQLVCLARALLTKARVLCLDEATASVDYATDQLIQQTLRTHLANCTIITIAHRLQTVMDYDRIVVMDGGRIVECDTPERLLANPRSHFAMLYQQSQRSVFDSGPSAD